MKFRWTIKELTEESDAFVLRGLVSERLSGLNPYTPLAKRLQQLHDMLSRQLDKEAERRSRKREMKKDA